MFSVVIPVFNHERYVQECVLSAARGEHISEVLLLDDGSSDDSDAQVKMLSAGCLKRVRDITPSPRVNRGAHACLNELVEAASSEWIAVLNSDDAFLSGRFSLIERWLNRHGDADFLFGNLAVMDGTGRQIGTKNGPFDPQYPFPASFSVAEMVRAGRWAELLSNQNFIATTSNMVFRKSLFCRIGGFAPYRYVHDWDFALRACLAGRARYIPHALTSYRVHASNTIKENGEKVDREVRSMFAAVARDFPALTSDRVFQEGMAGNTYLHPKTTCKLSMLMPEPGVYAKALEGRIRDVEVLPESDAERAAGYLIYAPTSSCAALRPGHLQNAVLALAFQDLDFVLVSHSLAEAPLLGIGDWRSAVVFRSRHKEVFLRGKPAPFALRGRVARLLPGHRDARRVELPFPAIWEAPALESPEANIIDFQASGMPVIFILPALFAVGGVERLILEMMRQLRGRYEFVLITVERLSEGHGSLHGEAEGLAHACFDLAELAPNPLFLPMLQRLKQIYSPVLVWVPNGSPWQCDNAQGLREVFHDVPMIDQQAYDTLEGWIARYHEPGMQSYDRFVAINTKIRDVFAGKYRIDPQKIDLIYHSINVGALGPLDRAPGERRAYREKYQLPAEGRIFGWVGRLTQQKRPLEFLEFVKRHPGEHFVMIGNGELAESCDKFIQHHNIGNVTPIRFSNAMGELYSVMSGLLIISAYEGLPISMLEAMAMGLPVLATDVGDIGLILKEYACGSVVAADWDLDRYSSAFREWLGNLPFAAPNAAPGIRARFGGPAVAALYEACFRKAQENFKALQAFEMIE